MPKGLEGHEMVSIGNDVIVIGGRDENYKYSDSIYKLSCTINICKLETLQTKLNVARAWFTAIPLPDDFIDCNLS